MCVRTNSVRCEVQRADIGRKFRFRRNPFLMKGESITSEAAILGSARAGAAPCWRRRRRRRRAPPLRRRRRTVATARASTRGEEDDAHLLPPSADSVRQHADDQLSVSDLVKKRTQCRQSIISRSLPALTLPPARGLRLRRSRSGTRTHPSPQATSLSPAPVQLNNARRSGCLTGIQAPVPCSP